MADRSYDSSYSIKDFAITEIAPKYFNVEEISLLNVGIFGMMVDFCATATEDSFNTVTTFINEMFPNKARLPESIYANAALFNIENLFAIPSELSMAILINEADIIKYGEDTGSILEFVLDSDMIINIEDKHFLLDYDINIQAKAYRGDYIFNASYVTSFVNTISDIKNPYIRIKRINYGNEKYLALLVKVRQLDKKEIEETLISNDKINIPTISFTFEEQLANFEVFYKEPGQAEYVQMTKKLVNTQPSSSPFCYYNLTDENEVTISFSPNDRYFQPLFNSEFIIVVYTCLGASGNFSLYNGTDLTMVPKSDVYQYNNKLLVLGIVQSESVFGADMLSLESLRNLTIEQYSTIKSYTTVNDLNLYFASFKYRYDNQIMFIKKRDDVFERLFSTFVLFRDSFGEVIPTNTVNFSILPADFDYVLVQSGKHLLRAGHLFTFDGDSKINLNMIAGMIYDTDLATIADDFIYTNPFLMIVSQQPTIVGCYINSFNSSHLMDYTYVNFNSELQFIVNKLYVFRNALNGDDRYTLSLEVLPSAEIDTELIVDELGADLENLKIKAFIEDSGTEICFIDFTMVGFDEASGIYKFEAYLDTDDYITETERVRITSARDVTSGLVETKYVPMISCHINIRTFFRYSYPIVPDHPYTGIDNLDDYIMTNTYETLDEPVVLIQPLNIVRAGAMYEDLGGGDYKFKLLSVPMNSAVEMKDPDKFNAFITSMYRQYTYLQSILSRITNNYSLDLKFFNTYGRSRNYLVGDDGSTVLDKVNCSIAFKIKPKAGVDEASLAQNVKIYIKNYIEDALSMEGTSTNNLYISNLIRQLEVNFPDIVYNKFVKINDYDSSVQVVWNKTEEFDSLTKDEKKVFIPEFLNIGIDDISITILGT